MIIETRDFLLRQVYSTRHYNLGTNSLDINGNKSLLMCRW